VVSVRQVMVARRLYKLFRFLIVRARVFGARNLRGSKIRILVSNHVGSFGPLSVITSLPVELYPWVIHDTTDPRTAADRIRREFIEGELHLKPPFSTWLARVVGRIAAAIMRDIGAVPVYQYSRRIVATVQRSLELMQRGKTLLVFPEDSTRRLNAAICEFCTGFIHLAKLFYEKTKSAVEFVPVAVNEKCRRIIVGKPITFDVRVPFPVEKARLKRELEQTITRLYLAAEEEGGLAAVGAL
jgi:1-acyl-sn-glycerol-3-phosphate acyltransferase